MAIKLGEMLLKGGLITHEQLEETLKTQVIYGGRIGLNLMELGYLDDETIARFLSQKLGVPFIEKEALAHINAEMIALLPLEVARKYRVVPLKAEKKWLTVAMADPTDLAAIDDIAFVTSCSIRPAVAPELALMAALGRYYDFHPDERMRALMAAGTGPAPSPAAPPPQAPMPTPPKKLMEKAEVVMEAAQQGAEGFSMDDLSRALADASDRDEIADALMGYLAGEFDRAALFIIKGNTATGWRGSLKGEILEDFNALHISLDDDTALRIVSEGKSFYLGPMTDSPGNSVIIASLGGQPPPSPSSSPS